MAGDTRIPTLSRTLVKAREMGRCLRCGAGRGSDWHHRRSRSVPGEHRHSPCNGVWLCRTCHEDVHKNPFQARHDGYIVSRHIYYPGEIPVKAHYGWVLLDEHGGFSHVADPFGEAGPQDSSAK